MGRGAKTPRGWETVGVQASQTLAGVGTGGGVQRLLHTALLRKPGVKSTPQSGSGTVTDPVTDTDAELAQIELPRSGLWAVNFYGTAIWDTEGLDEAGVEVDLETGESDSLLPDQTPWVPGLGVSATAGGSYFYSGPGPLQARITAYGGYSSGDPDPTETTVTITAHLIS